MDQLFDVRTLITLFGIIASVAVTWGVMRTRMNTLIEDLKGVRSQIKSQWEKIDELNQTVAVLDSKQKVVSSMLDPKEVKEFNMGYADFKARTDERLKALEYWK